MTSLAMIVLTRAHNCLYTTLQGTRVEKVINELFEGTTHNFITCMNVDYSRCLSAQR